MKSQYNYIRQSEVVQLEGINPPLKSIKTFALTGEGFLASKEKRYFANARGDMKDIIDKISSYNLFNYLLPGAIFVILANALTPYSFNQQDILLGVFFYYFIGLVISRFGSLVIEPILKKLMDLKSSDYRGFISESKKDPKIELLSETSNMYRTFCSMFALLVLVKFYAWLEALLPELKNWRQFGLVLALLIIFVLSYRKQTGYINDRIKASSGDAL